MATSSKDIETLWNRYSNEVTKQGIILILQKNHDS